MHAPQSGDYVFWLAGDGQSELHLSSDDSLNNAALIARVKGWTKADRWDRCPEQQSDPVSLVAGSIATSRW